MAVTSMRASSFDNFVKSNAMSGKAGTVKAMVSATTGSPDTSVANVYRFTGDGSITFSRAGFVDVLVVGVVAVALVSVRLRALAVVVLAVLCAYSRFL